MQSLCFLDERSTRLTQSLPRQRNRLGYADADHHLRQNQDVSFALVK